MVAKVTLLEGTPLAFTVTNRFISHLSELKFELPFAYRIELISNPSVYGVPQVLKIDDDTIHFDFDIEDDDDFRKTFGRINDALLDRYYLAGAEDCLFSFACRILNTNISDRFEPEWVDAKATMYWLNTKASKNESLDGTPLMRFKEMSGHQGQGLMAQLLHIKPIRVVVDYETHGFSRLKDLYDASTSFMREQDAAYKHYVEHIFTKRELVVKVKPVHPETKSGGEDITYAYFLSKQLPGCFDVETKPLPTDSQNIAKINAGIRSVLPEAPAWVYTYGEDL